MKKILVISDSHGSKQKIAKVINEETWDYIFFLGDGLKDMAFLEGDNIIKVAGNCDLFSTETEQKSVVIESVKFLLTHGHIYKVKWGLGALINEASKRDANVVCFGHTHTYMAEEINNILFLNPGSLYSSQYCIIEVCNGKITLVKQKNI